MLSKIPLCASPSGIETASDGSPVASSAYCPESTQRLGPLRSRSLVFRSCVINLCKHAAEARASESAKKSKVRIVSLLVLASHASAGNATQRKLDSRPVPQRAPSTRAGAGGLNSKQGAARKKTSSDNFHPEGGPTQCHADRPPKGRGRPRDQRSGAFFCSTKLHRRRYRMRQRPYSFVSTIPHVSVVNLSTADQVRWRGGTDSETSYSVNASRIFRCRAGIVWSFALFFPYDQILCLLFLRNGRHGTRKHRR